MNWRLQQFSDLKKRWLMWAHRDVDQLDEEFERGALIGDRVEEGKSSVEFVGRDHHTQASPQAIWSAYLLLEALGRSSISWRTTFTPSCPWILGRGRSLRFDWRHKGRIIANFIIQEDGSYYLKGSRISLSEVLREIERRVTS